MPCSICYSNLFLNLCICIHCTTYTSNLLLILYNTICYVNILLYLFICTFFIVSILCPGYVPHLCRCQVSLIK